MADSSLTIIEEYASKIKEAACEILGQIDDVSLFLKRFVELLGGTIEVLKEPNELEKNGGSLVINKDSTFTINLPPYTSPLRDNFTIAHELGHFLIDYQIDKSKRIYYRYGDGNGAGETLANQFAASFLMPETKFRDDAKKYDNSILQLSAHFQVSTDTIQSRMDALNIR